MTEYSSQHFSFEVEGTHPVLGAPIEHFRGSWMTNVQRGSLFAFGALFLAIFAMGAASKVNVPGLLQGQLDEQSLGSLVAFGFFALAAVGCLYPVLRAIEGATTVLVIHERGLAKQSFLTSREVLWDEIASVLENHSLLFRNGELVSTHHSIRLTLADRKKVTLELSQVDTSDLASSLIAQHTLPRLSEQAAARFLAEGKVQFGPITMYADDLRQEGLLWSSVAAWKDIKKFKVENGHLLIWTGNEWFGSWGNIPLACIPDYRVLLVMLDSQLYGPMSGGDHKGISQRFRETGSMLAAWPGER
jgi:hypothetical protein